MWISSTNSAHGSIFYLLVAQPRRKPKTTNLKVVKSRFQNIYSFRAVSRTSLHWYHMYFWRLMSLICLLFHHQLGRPHNSSKLHGSVIFTLCEGIHISTVVSLDKVSVMCKEILWHVFLSNTTWMCPVVDIACHVLLYSQKLHIMSFAWICFVLCFHIIGPYEYKSTQSSTLAMDKSIYIHIVKAEIMGWGRLNMGIPISDKDRLYIETGPKEFCLSIAIN